MVKSTAPETTRTRSKNKSWLTMTRLPVMTAVLTAMLAACSSSGDAPSGQVVATVDGKEITLSELRSELGGAQAPMPVQQAALQRIIMRKILAEAARKDGLEKSAEGAIARQRAEELALIQQMEASLTKKVPQVSDSEAADYVRDNPSAFAGRRVLTVEQLSVPKVDAQVIEAVKPLETMGEIRNLLDSRKLGYNRGFSQVDTMTIPAQAATQLDSMTVGSVYVVNGNGGMIVNAIREISPAPLQGDVANKAAKNFLMFQRTQKQVGQQMEALIENAQKSVKINAEYRPPAAKPAAKPAAAPKG